MTELTRTLQEGMYFVFLVLFFVVAYQDGNDLSSLFPQSVRTLKEPADNLDRKLKPLGIT